MDDVTDLTCALVAIDSVNPGLVPGAAGEAEIVELGADARPAFPDNLPRIGQAGGRLYATSPSAIAGRIEARGLGIIRASTRPMARIAAVIACAEPIERLPEPETHVLEGVAVPLFRLNPFAASAAVLARQLRVAGTARPAWAW